MLQSARQHVVTSRHGPVGDLLNTGPHQTGSEATSECRHQAGLPPPPRPPRHRRAHSLHPISRRRYVHTGNIDM